MTDASIARVLIDSPLPQLDRLFDYAIPEKLRAEAKAGVRVKAPLRTLGRLVEGWIVELTDTVDYAGKLSELDSVISPFPVLSPEVWTLARTAADRAAGNAADVLRLGIPKRHARAEKTLPDPATTTFAPLVKPGPVAFFDEGAIETLVTQRKRAALSAPTGVTEVAPGVWVGRWAVTMVELAAHALFQGTTTILATPDFRDQEQLEAAAAALLPADRVLRLDARQSVQKRYGNFLRTHDNTAYVIIGNRSAVYAPAANLGLIVVWDDGDSLYSENLSPYIHTRDAALLRQEQQQSALVFLSHSRSTEVQRLVEVGWLVALNPGGLRPPKVIPSANQVSQDRLAAIARIPSAAWKAARAGLDEGPVLVQVARPGYAPRLACADCAQTARCTTCAGPLAQRSASATPSCVWCGALAVKWRCRECDGVKLRMVGSGSARTADELGRAFPGYRVIVADGDHQVLTVANEPSLVIATRGAEPVAEGGYRAVLLLDGAGMLARESLRVAEDCLRWWSNAIALAADGAPTVIVGVGGALATSLVTWRQEDFALTELADRRELRFPPAVRVATLTGKVALIDDAIRQLPVAPLDILGPVDLPGGLVRTIVRFDYKDGAAVAEQLKALVVTATTVARSSRKPGTPRAQQPPPGLRVHLDDLEPFVDL
ncbi:primosomal protein N' [Salinibacterium sp. SWN1162]|uniref:primosomal protein N' family DNA-binding protein n=1 Tax=Salinibacterium sp. SWN1162 TaxID=2792053 RepID=UPI0018CCE0E7|nr:primosomal protein N' [Salinibacterium sp. SWN1162]MBH0009300.1 primosomal protein N' [Salinibacterium sp. SWN1162]